MSVAGAPRLTDAECLALEASSEERHEYIDGEVFAMAGASDRHHRIAMNIGGELRSRLRSGPCFAVGSDQRHKVERTRLYTYPDVAVRCREEGGPAVTRVVFEVLSSATEAWDRGGKFAHLPAGSGGGRVRAGPPAGPPRGALPPGGGGSLGSDGRDRGRRGRAPCPRRDPPAGRDPLGPADERSDDERDPLRLG